MGNYDHGPFTEEIIFTLNEITFGDIQFLARLEPLLRRMDNTSCGGRQGIHLMVMRMNILSSEIGLLVPIMTPVHEVCWGGFGLGVASIGISDGAAIVLGEFLLGPRHSVVRPELGLGEDAQDPGLLSGRLPGPVLLQVVVAGLDGAIAELHDHPDQTIQGGVHE